MALITGTAGNDTLYGGLGDDVLDGGDGDDWLYGKDGNDIITGGLGNDLIAGGLGDDTLTGGVGSDYFELWTDLADTSVDTITDFTAGLGGDYLSIPTGFFTNYTSGTNPFATGHARLTQSGTDTLVELDTDGVGGAAAFQTVAILSNVAKASLVPMNLYGIDPNAIGGTDLADAMTGTVGDDNIDAMAGNDTVNGLAGNDSLYGGLGDDVLDGGDGDDVLLGNAGDDSIIGGLGNDYIDGGLGNDTLTGGAGWDYFHIWSDLPDTSVDTITDFTAGLGGDHLSIPTWALTDYTPGTNPFASGHARLTQSGTDTLLELDTDGAGGPATFQTVAILNNVTKTSLDGNNFMGDYDPNVVGGTALADALTGTAGNDNIDGLAGNDTLNGLAGNDTMYGGLGDDVLDGGDGDDVLHGNDGNDSIAGGLGS